MIIIISPKKDSIRVLYYWSVTDPKVNQLSDSPSLVTQLTSETLNPTKGSRDESRHVPSEIRSTHLGKYSANPVSRDGPARITEIRLCGRAQTLGDHDFA